MIYGHEWYVWLIGFFALTWPIRIDFAIESLRERVRFLEEVLRDYSE
jgi:hypothetical protein